MAGPLASKDLLILGSIPLDTAEEVFRWVGGSGLVPHVAGVPDGEVGDRSYWIVGVAYRVFNGHPDIETVKFPARVDGVENWKPKNMQDMWSFKVKDGVKEVRFGDPGRRLGYARDAIESYFVFRTLREKGVFPADMRFQVCLPMSFSTYSGMFREYPEGYSALADGFDDAMIAEIARIAEKIPPRDLMFQFDSTTESVALTVPPGGAMRHGMKAPQNVDMASIAKRSIGRLSAAVPRDALMGYHLCIGSLTDWPMTRPADLGTTVACMNTMLELSKRPVDFIHFPVLDKAGEEFYAPLKNLILGRTKFYVGVIHNMADTDDYLRRLDLVRRYIKEFGIGSPCGYGRLNPERLPSILADHMTALRLLKGTHATV
jgi:hypothetical protein